MMPTTDCVEFLPVDFGDMSTALPRAGATRPTGIGQEAMHVLLRMFLIGYQRLIKLCNRFCGHQTVDDVSV